MNLTSEQVHFIGGVAFTAVALILLLFAIRGERPRWTSYLLPGLLVAYGIESFSDHWVHGAAVPQNYGAESAQHLVQGGLVLTAGMIEWLRVSERLRHPLWRLVMPVGLLLVGTIFMVHAQHGAGGGMMAMVVQHRAFGIALWVAGLAKLLGDWAGKRGEVFSTAWLFPLLVFGVLLMIYTEANPAMQQAMQ